MSRRWIALITILLAVASFGAAAQEQAAAKETESSVPALDAFHEVIYPIWHTAYPEKDVAALKSYVPEIDKLAANIYVAKLPGILREKEAKWKAGVAEFRKSVEAYDAAAKGADNEALLKAAEALHMRYEMLVRTIRPVLPEMDAFHKALYVVYHTDVPGNNWDAVRKAAPDMRTKAEAVAKAQLSKRLEAKAAAFEGAAAELVTACKELEAAAGSNADGNALKAAVDKVHARYQALEKIFD